MKNEMSGASGRYRRQQRCIQSFFEIRTPLGRSRHRWKENNRLDEKK